MRAARAHDDDHQSDGDHLPEGHDATDTPDPRPTVGHSSVGAEGSVVDGCFGDDETWGTAPEEVAQRRAGDIRVAGVMRQIDYDIEHPFAKALIHRLRQQCGGTLIRLWESGNLFPRMFRMKYYVPIPPPPSWQDEAYSILNEAAVRATPKFVGTRLERWTPSGGASLTTYCTNFVLGSDFKTLYQTYYRREQQRASHEVSYEEHAPDLRVLDRYDELDQTLDNILAADILAQQGQLDREILVRLSEGDSQASIARQLGLSPKAVSRRVEQRRTQLRGKYGRTTEDGE